jgi:hypothetical protein
MFHSVAAPPMNKQMTDVHSNYAADVPNKEQPGLALMLSDNAIFVKKSVEFIGLLATGVQSNLHPIEGATVNIQQLNSNGTAWHILGTVQTSSKGKDAGFFTGSYYPKIKGYHILSGNL